MSYQSKRVLHVKGNSGGGAGQDVLDFRDPSWIIDHHRHHLIKKISKPESSSGEVLARSSNDHNNQSHNHQLPGGSRYQENATVDGERGLSSQQPLGPVNHRRLEESEQSYRINLSELQRLHLRKLQYKLVQHVVDLRYDALEPSGWADDLRQYVQSLRDYDYMEQHTFTPRDPFYVTGERFIDRCMLQAAMKNKENEADPLHWAKSMGKWETSDVSPEPIGGVRDEKFWQARIRGLRQRLGVAAVGAIFLILPMWLMVLHNTLYTALGSTTVFVAIFGLVMAFFLDRLMDVLSSTAAYAAVLVVFVALTITNNTC